MSEPAMKMAIHARACHALVIVCAGVVLTAAQDDRDAAAVVRLVELLQIRAGCVIADVGAGSGALVPPMAARVGKDGRLYATDVNQDRLKELRSLAAKDTLGNITVIEGAAAHTNLPEACCDGIFMRLVYHHFGDPPAMTASLRRSLKPGGRLVIVDFTPTAGRSAAPGQRTEGDRHGVTAATVIEELKAAGFEDVQETPWSKEPEFAVIARRPFNQTVLLGTYLWDLETNAQTGKARFDLFWEQLRPGVQNLVPQAGAGLTIVKDTTFDALSADDLRRLPYVPASLPGTSLMPGTVLAIRTSEGNFAKAQVIGYRSSYDFSFESAKQIPPDRQALARSRAEVRERHLELRWVLFEK